MKKNKQDIFNYVEKLEKNDELFHKWGELYRLEEDILKTIVKVRKDRGLSQKDVAELTNLKQPAIARIENGVNSPQLNTLIKIADALDLKFSIDDKNCYDNKLNIYDSDIYKNLLDEINNLYDQLHSKKTYEFSMKKGGINYEDYSYQCPCNQNYTA